MLRSLIRRRPAWEAGRLLLATHPGRPAAPAAASLLVAARWQHTPQGFDVREEALSGKMGADAASAVRVLPPPMGGGRCCSLQATARSAC